MRALLALIPVLLIGCSGTFGQRADTFARYANPAAATVAGATYALDWCGTRSAAETRWHAGKSWEGGYPAAAIMGGQPSTRTVDAYFAVSAAVLIGLSRVVPERYRWIGYAAVTVTEISAIETNLSTTTCGPIGNPTIR